MLSSNVVFEELVLTSFKALPSLDNTFHFFHPVRVTSGLVNLPATASLRSSLSQLYQYVNEHDGRSIGFSLCKVQIFQFAKYRFFNSQSTDFSLRKVQIFQFAKYRFLKYRKVQISQFAKYRFFNSQSTDFSIRKVQIFQFAKYRFLNSQSTDFSIRKVQISQFTSTDFSIRKVQINQFAKYRFFNSQSTDFSIISQVKKYMKVICDLRSEFPI